MIALHFISLSLQALDLHVISHATCRDADDVFYDRTEGGQRRKKAAEPEALDAATLLGQKVKPNTCFSSESVLWVLQPCVADK